MVQLQIIEESAVMMAELKDELARIKERDKELSFRAARTDEHLQVFAPLDSKKAKELQKKLEELEVPRLRPMHIAKIVDILPRNVDELKMILQGYTITVTNENIKKIVELVAQYQLKK